MGSNSDESSRGGELGSSERKSKKRGRKRAGSNRNTLGHARWLKYKFFQSPTPTHQSRDLFPILFFILLFIYLFTFFFCFRVVETSQKTSGNRRQYDTNIRMKAKKTKTNDECTSSRRPSVKKSTNAMTLRQQAADRWVIHQTDRVCPKLRAAASRTRMSEKDKREKRTRKLILLLLLLLLQVDSSRAAPSNLDGAPR